MKSQDIKWFGPFRLFNLRSGKTLEVDKKPGVYRVRAFAENGRPLQIKRLAGGDPLGILHIGKSVTLRSRIQAFRRSSEDGRNGHKAGIEFYEYQFDELIPLTTLRYDYVFAKTEQEALELERNLHEEYRKQYLDRPPLDGTSGQFSSK
jgi:excinuclease UvrABC nuclease subunit